MKDFRLLIEGILAEKDCVIVPGLGAFVASYAPSEYSEQEELFLPPYRRVHFNAELQYDNDMSLVRAVAASDHIDPRMAELVIGREVLQVKQELLENGNYDMGSIGTLVQEEDGTLFFEPCQAGVNSPSLFGLYSFQMSRVQQGYTVEEPTAVSTVSENKNYTFSISRTLVHYSVAAAAAVILFFLFITPAENTQTVKDQMRSELFLPANLTPEHQTSTPKVAPAPQITSEETEEVAEVEEVEEAGNADVMEYTPTQNPASDYITPQPAETTYVRPEPRNTPVRATAATQVVEDTPTGNDTYGIVLTSIMSTKSAGELVEVLKARGFSNASIYTKGSMSRVILSGYKSEHEANTKADEIRRDHEEFGSAWVLKM